MILTDICHAQAPRERRKCVCHISRHSSVVAVLEGIRGALIQTRAVKSVRGLPSRTYYLGTSIGSFVHAADELHHAMLLYSRKRAPDPFWNRRKKHHGAYGNAVAREKSMYPVWMYRSHLVELYKGAPTAIRLLRKHACDFVSKSFNCVFRRN